MRKRKTILLLSEFKLPPPIITHRVCYCYTLAHKYTPHCTLTLWNAWNGVGVKWLQSEFYFLQTIRVLRSERERASETINRPMKKEGGGRSKVRKSLKKELKLVGGYLLLLLTDWGRLGLIWRWGRRCLTRKFCGCVGVSFTKYLCACIKQSQSITGDYYHGILCVFNRKRVEGDGL